MQGVINTSILEIQKLEDSIQTQQLTCNALQDQATAERDKLKNQESHIITLVNYLNHSKDFSPFLSVLSTKEVSEIIHLSILLKYVSASLPEKFKDTFERLKSLAAARHELSQAQSHLSSLEAKKRQNFSVLKKQFSELEELLELQNKPLPIRHFDSASQIEAVVKRLTDSASPCQKVKNLTDLKIEIPIFYTPAMEDETLFYKGIKDSIVRSPFDAKVILSGYSAETEGVILIRTREYIMLVEGLDKIVSFMGTRVKEQQPLGLIFSCSDNADKSLKVTLWQCKQRM